MQIFARRGERFRCGVLEIPQLVLHPAVEFVGIFLTLQMEFHADGSVLEDKRGWEMEKIARRC